MMPSMKHLLTGLAAVAALVGSAPAAAGASNFTLVNATDAAFTEVAIRRVGTEAWRPLPVAVSPRARAAVQFSDPDCAFDVRATIAGVGPVIWPGVNLCEVTALTLNRNAAGLAWADYE